MWYYIFVGFIMIGGIILSRLNSAYHHEMLFKRHITIKNKKLQKLFIWQSDPFGGSNDNKKAYRSKMTIHGICFYIVWALLFVFCIGFLIWGPETPIEPFEFDDGFVCSTLNKGVVLMSAVTFDCFTFAFYALNIVRCRDVKSHKFVTVLWWLFVITMWVLSIMAIVELVKLF